MLLHHQIISELGKEVSFIHCGGNGSVFHHFPNSIYLIHLSKNLMMVISSSITRGGLIHLNLILAKTCFDGERIICITVKIHSVTSCTVVKCASGNFPVAVCFDLTFDVTHCGTKILYTISAKCLL